MYGTLECVDGLLVLGEMAGSADDHCGVGVPDTENLEGYPIKVYLAHPYSKKAEVEVIYQPKLEEIGLEVINPFHRGEQKVYDKVLKDGTGLTDEMCADIVKMDLEKIDNSDGVVAMLIDDNMIGTIMEVFYTSYMKGKPVFSFAPREREKKHPWIRNLTIVCPDETALYDNLTGWMSGRR